MENVGGTPDTAIYKWNFRNSLIDTVQGIVATTNGNIIADGVEIVNNNRYLELPGIFDIDRTYWLKFSSFNTRDGGVSSYNGRVLCVSNNVNTNNYGSCFAYRNNNTIAFYIRNQSGWQSGAISSAGLYNAFQNSWMKMYCGSNNITIYKDDEVFFSINKGWGASAGNSIIVGGNASDSVHDVTITEAKVYQGLVI